MSIFNRLWIEEHGSIISAEAVMVSSIGIIGVLVGLGTVSKSVDAELKDVAYAIRSLDQSYMVASHRSPGGWSAGSMFVQPDAKQSIRELQATERELEERLRQQLKDAGIAPDAVTQPAPQTKQVEPPRETPKEMPVERKKNRKPRLKDVENDEE